MAERKKQKKKKEELESQEDEKPSKEQYAVAKYLKNNLPVKKTTLLGHKVEYFIASKAINVLLDSQWASGAKNTPNIFTDRESVERYLDIMLQKKFFHRAKKFVQKDSKKPKKKDDDTADERKSGKEEEKKSGKEDDKEIEGDKKKKRKVKLDMHLEQLFVDGNDAYVWIYDPIPMKSWLIGALIVFGSIALCLFPLWPATIRLGVYYLSVAAAGFLVVLLGLAVVRLIIFSILWGCSMGKHHFWLLPNLMEDVGFLESFWPLYFYEYKGDVKISSVSTEEESLKSSVDEKENETAKSIEKEGNADSDSKDSASDHNSEDDRTDNGFEVLDQKEISSEIKGDS
ncbi:Translocation protein SEC62 [Nymphon striatum]|nr:Translocation protein SEC62 [Nymphon striatum]